MLAAELTFAWADDGPDVGRLVMDSLVCKPRWSWAFRVNRFNAIQCIRGWTGDGWLEIDREKFALLSWKPKHRDPRGRSGFRAAYNPWNLKIQQYPEFGEYLHHFAEPGIAVTLGKGAQPAYSTNAVTGKQILTDPLDVVSTALAGYQNRSRIALPEGSTVTVIESSGEGGAYHGAFDRFDMEIFRAILFSGRPVMEAAHGSKADSGEGRDLLNLSFQQGRAPLCRMVESNIYYPFVKLNWGKDVADRLTPKATFGSSTDIDGTLLAAFADAYQKGFLDEGQIPILWDRLGLPPLDDATLAARVEKKNAPPPVPVVAGADPNAPKDQTPKASPKPAPKPKAA